MAEAYGTLGATVPESDDYASGGADVPKAFRAYSDSLGEGKGAGKLLVVQSTGAAAWKAMSGDATLAADGTLSLGAGVVGATELADGAATSAKVKPTILTASLGLIQELGTSYASLSGTSVEVTPSVSSTLLVVASFQFFATSGKQCTGTLSLDGSDQTQAASIFVTSESGGAMATQVFALSLTAAKHTIVMRAKCASSSSGSAGVQSRMVGLLLAA